MINVFRDFFRLHRRSFIISQSGLYHNLKEGTGAKFLSLLWFAKSLYRYIEWVGYSPYFFSKSVEVSSSELINVITGLFITNINEAHKTIVALSISIAPIFELSNIIPVNILEIGTLIFPKNDILERTLVLLLLGKHFKSFVSIVTFIQFLAIPIISSEMNNINKLLNVPKIKNAKENKREEK
ncbi:hypothetical protein V2H36_04705, partial [Avibacterium paragallinarum]|nr:hypothetical protein [Avibacterium paragallinarum]